MISFRDRWWCGEQRECAKAKTCDRVFRSRHHYEARRWWGDDDYPVDFHANPECFEPDEPEVDTSTFANHDGTFADND